MTSPKQPPAPESVSEEAVADATQDTSPASAIPAFSFPFKPADFANAKKTDQPWYQKGGPDKNRKSPGAAPPGTRRSMGKR